jgi:hypothetical protein
MSFLIALIKICLLAIFVGYCTQSQHDSRERRLGEKGKLVIYISSKNCGHSAKRLAHPRSPIPPLSTLTARAMHARPLRSAALAFVS